MIYLMGSLANRKVRKVAKAIRAIGWEVFDDWQSSPTADIEWQEYEAERGRTYREALHGFHAQEVVNFDKRHLDRCQVGVLVMPAGKSAHIELGYLIGRGTPAYVLFEEEPDRYDVMYGLATDVFFDLDELLEVLQGGVPLSAPTWRCPIDGEA